jgi:Putative MetA-pathway of phenol degradation
VTKKVLLYLYLCTMLPVAMHAQDNFFEKWEARTTATQSKQPAWTPPIFEPYVGLIQVARTDFTRQINPARYSTWNMDTSKGVNLIPWANTEIDFNLPPYFIHQQPGVKDGAGDWSMTFKYRIMTGNLEHGNFIWSASLPFTVPTGSYKNGSTNGSVSPTMGFGKGFGPRFNITMTLNGTLPLGNTVKLGRPMLWCATAQYHLGKYFWPEIESNATYFHGGPNDGKNMEFITPGLMIGKIALRPSDKKSRLGLGFGAGEQIATSKFHTYNHALIFTGRLLF